MKNINVKKRKIPTKLEVGRQVFSGLNPIPKPHTGGYMKDIKAEEKHKKR